MLLGATCLKLNRAFQKFVDGWDGHHQISFAVPGKDADDSAIQIQDGTTLAGRVNLVEPSANS